MQRNRMIRVTLNTPAAGDDINNLIQQGRIAREGTWYRVHDLDVLRNELLWLIKSMSVSSHGTLVKLYN